MPSGMYTSRRNHRNVYDQSKGIHRIETISFPFMNQDPCPVQEEGKRGKGFRIGKGGIEDSPILFFDKRTLDPLSSRPIRDGFCGSGRSDRSSAGLVPHGTEGRFLRSIKRTRYRCPVSHAARPSSKRTDRMPFDRDEEGIFFFDGKGIRKPTELPLPFPYRLDRKKKGQGGIHLSFPNPSLP